MTKYRSRAQGRNWKLAYSLGKGRIGPFVNPRDFSSVRMISGHEPPIIYSTFQGPEGIYIYIEGNLLALVSLYSVV